jgi:hypothetical protein
VADEPIRNALLAACRAHVADGGCVIVQQHPPEWFAEADDAERASGRNDLPAARRVTAGPEPGLGDRRAPDPQIPPAREG